MSTINIEREMSYGAKNNFNFIKTKVSVDGKYANGMIDGWVCVATYRGKPVFGYLKHSVYAGDKLVLHRMDTMEYNSFAGSQAEQGQWVLFSSLNDGRVCKDHIEELKEYAEKEYGWFDTSIKNKPMKKKNSPINWSMNFENEGGDIVIANSNIRFDGVDWTPEGFKNNFDLRRAVLAKYEKEFGKVS